MSRPGTHIRSNGNHFIISNRVTKIVMMNVINFIGQKYEFKMAAWLPCWNYCYHYSSRLTIDMKASVMYLDGPVDVSQWNSWPWLIQDGCQVGHFEIGHVMSRPETHISSYMIHFISSSWVTEVVMMNVMHFLLSLLLQTDTICRDETKLCELCLTWSCVQMKFLTLTQGGHF